MLVQLRERSKVLYKASTRLVLKDFPGLEGLYRETLETLEALVLNLDFYTGLRNKRIKADRNKRRRKDGEKTGKDDSSNLSEESGEDAELVELAEKHVVEEVKKSPPKGESIYFIPDSRKKGKIDITKDVMSAVDSVLAEVPLTRHSPPRPPIATARDAPSLTDQQKEMNKSVSGFPLPPGTPGLTPRMISILKRCGNDLSKLPDEVRFLIADKLGLSNVV